MPKTFTLFRCALVSSLFLTTFLSCPLFAAEDSVALFNGKDLTGWQFAGVGKEMKDAWKVSDGILQTNGKGGWLATEQEYADFELELEFNVSPGGNSGVFLRAPLEGPSHIVGMEIQLIDDFTDVYGKLKDWQLTGSLYGVQPAKPGAVKKADEWQKMKILVAGRKLQVTLNGQVVTDVNLDSFPDKAKDLPGLKNSKGYIGLQNYGKPIKFRHIKLKKLP